MSQRNEKALLAILAREESRLAELDTKRDQTLEKIEDLRSELEVEKNSQQPSTPALSEPSASITSNEKVKLFQKLFRGRADVFPKRWKNSKKGSTGYSPACENEWVRGVCDKPRVKCGECQSQAFLPITDKVILDHLHGRLVAGVYPLLKDESCWFLAADFDKGSWREDVSAFRETCGYMKIPVAIERSRSGNGAHAWFFFKNPVVASVARKMGCYLITATMSRRHELPMKSYDRLFPNQDTMPKGGFGNLIALPFQDGPRQQENSVFVDEHFTPYEDQWSYLASLSLMDSMQVESLSLEASKKGMVIGMQLEENMADVEESVSPWFRPPSRQYSKPVITEQLPTQTNAVLSQLLFVEKTGLPSPLLNQIKRLAAFQNPEFYKKQSMRLSTALTPRVISCAEEFPKHIGLPRGCVDGLRELLDYYKIALEIKDSRSAGDRIDTHFRGKLTVNQERAVEALLEHDTGVFVAPPGSGKTIVGVNLITRRLRSTLILVHRTQLLDQWIAQLSVFLDINAKEIGQIGDGKRKPNGNLDVAMIQSMVKGEKVADIVASYGQVIVDECHHVPAVSFERVMREIKAKYVTGLTATPQRRDGNQPILRLQLGPVRYSISTKSQMKLRPFDHRLIIRETEFRLSDCDDNVGIQEIYRKLTLDEKRNELILNDVIQSLEEGRSPILLTERRDHLEYFAEKLDGFARNLVILRGGIGKKQRREAANQLENISKGEERLILATGRFIGEGFDDARLDTLFLAMPVSWKGTLVQYAGRLHRGYQTKTEVRIMDYVDSHVPMLSRMFDKRMRGYRAMGYVPAENKSVGDQINGDYVIEYDVDSGGLN